MKIQFFLNKRNDGDVQAKRTKEMEQTLFKENKMKEKKMI